MKVDSAQKTILIQGLSQAEILEIVSDSTVQAILDNLATGKKRFKELSGQISGSTKTLSSRLKRLESLGLISRTLHAEVPPRVEYALSEKGIEFVQILSGLVEWNAGWE